MKLDPINAKFGKSQTYGMSKFYYSDIINSLKICLLLVVHLMMSFKITYHYLQGLD